MFQSVTVCQSNYAVMHRAPGGNLKRLADREAGTATETMARRRLSGPAWLLHVLDVTPLGFGKIDRR